MGLFTRRKERKRASALPNQDAHNRARELATNDPTLDYMIMYSVLQSGGSEEQAIEASRNTDTDSHNIDTSTITDDHSDSFDHSHDDFNSSDTYGTNDSYGSGDSYDSGSSSYDSGSSSYDSGGGFDGGGGGSDGGGGGF